MQLLKRILLIVSSASGCLMAGIASAQNNPAPVPINPRAIAAPASAPAPDATAPAPPPTTPTLVFDAETKEYKSKPLELSAPFIFNLTNVWTNEIVIRAVHTSCGCTVASLPSACAALMTAQTSAGVSEGRLLPS